MRLSTTSWVLFAVALAATIALLFFTQSIAAIALSGVVGVAMYFSGWCDGFLRGVKEPRG